MGAQRNHTIRRPLPPDLRKEMKADLRTMAATRARKVGEARALQASKVADAKSHCRAAITRAEREYDDQRKATAASYETKAAQRRVAAVQATT